MKTLIKTIALASVVSSCGSKKSTETVEYKPEIKPTQTDTEEKTETKQDDNNKQEVDVSIFGVWDVYFGGCIKRLVLKQTEEKQDFQGEFIDITMCWQENSGLLEYRTGYFQFNSESLNFTTNYGTCPDTIKNSTIFYKLDTRLTIYVSNSRYLVMTKTDIEKEDDSESNDDNYGVITGCFDESEEGFTERVLEKIN